MMKYISIGLVAAALLAPSTISAATLSYIGTGQTHTVTRNDIDQSLNTTIDIITGDQKSAQNGLYLNVDGGAANVTYTYIGSEAGHRNFSAVINEGAFLNHGASSVGDQLTNVVQSSGLLAFAFGTVAPRYAQGVIFNNALAYPASPDFAIGYSQIDANSFFVMFDDIASGDRDFDDLVLRIDVAAVPLPAGILLLLSAFGGMLMMRRRTPVAQTA